MRPSQNNITLWCSLFSWVLIWKMCVCIYVYLLFCICGCGGSTLGSHTETACSSNPVVRKCSGLLLFFFLEGYSVHRRENCKDISSWLPLHCYISAQCLSTTTQQNHRGEIEEECWSPAGALEWMFYRWKDEKEMKQCPISMLIYIFLKCGYKILFLPCQFFLIIFNLTP